MCIHDVCFVLFAQIRFINPECSPDNVCRSNLELQYKFCSRKKSQNNMDVYEPLARCVYVFFLWVDEGHLGFIMWLHCVFREGDIAIITPSKEDIALEITVTNRDGKPAHQAHVTIRLPDTLGYTSAVHAGSVSKRQRAIDNTGRYIESLA